MAQLPDQVAARLHAAFRALNESMNQVAEEMKTSADSMVEMLVELELLDNRSGCASADVINKARTGPDNPF